MLMSGKRFVSDLEASRSFAHRTNIERYKKLLQTFLTEHERAFVQRRLDEERRAQAQLHTTDA